MELMKSTLGLRMFDPDVDLVPGEPIVRNIIENGLDKTKASVLFVSKNFLRSGLCQFILDNALWMYMITKGKYRVIPIVLDKCKIPRCMRVLNCIYCWKYQQKMRKDDISVYECLIQLINRFVKALKGPRLTFRRIQLRGVKPYNDGTRILRRLRNIMKRDRILGEKKDSSPLLGFLRLVNVIKHCILTCKYGDCSFSCSGENFRKLEKHLQECWYLPIQCPNRKCPFTSRRNVMKKHLEECEFSIQKCPVENCTIKMQRHKMASHIRVCPNRLVSCENESYGCTAVVPFKDHKKHLSGCPWAPQHCEDCGGMYLQKDQQRHDCPFAIKECPHCEKLFARKDLFKHLQLCFSECKSCNECFSKSKLRYHLCPIIKCRYQYCDYKDTRLRVEIHMLNCQYRPVECNRCKKFFPWKSFKMHQTECEKIIECKECGIQIYRDSQLTHDLMMCTAKRNRYSCRFCERLIKEGVIKNAYQLEQHHNMHDPWQHKKMFNKDSPLLQNEELIDKESAE
ncbi:zinc finger protein 883-like, partial [Saccostrea cucullata]|uniref:zinc finger protein 883-like n=1 Tax=Saccostrea cuccullata TaxID=36930 RepID=UPI002ED37BE5